MRTNSRAVIKFDLEGNLKYRYDRLSDVTMHGHSISSVHSVAGGKRYTHQKYIFMWEDECTPDTISNRVNRVKSKYSCNFRKIGQYEMDGTFVRSWDSLVQAEREGHFDRCLIWNTLNGHNAHHGGYLWKYLDNSEELKEVM